MTHETRDRARPLDAGFFMRVKAYYITGMGHYGMEPVDVR
jgi:hypothetical protein